MYLMVVTARTALVGLVLVSFLVLGGCRDKSCIDGVCALPCEQVRFSCPGPATLYAGRSVSVELSRICAVAMACVVGVVER